MELRTLDLGTSELQNLGTSERRDKQANVATKIRSVSDGTRMGVGPHAN